VTSLEMIYLPLPFKDEMKARNLEVDFLIVDVPTTHRSFWDVQLYTGLRLLSPHTYWNSTMRPMMAVLASSLETNG